MQGAALCVYLAVQLLLDLICISSGSEVRKHPADYAPTLVLLHNQRETSSISWLNLEKLFPTSIQLI